MIRDTKFDWMNEAIYEPPPVEYSRSIAPVTAWVFGWLMVLAVIGGALWAFNN